MTVDGHVRAFAFFGGVPHTISYDNLKAAVQTILVGRKRREQEAFTQFRSTYLFESRFCTPGEGHQKGQIEHAVGYGRRNFMTPLIKAKTFEDLNAQLLRACQNDLTRTVEGQASSMFDMLLHERPNLRALPTRPFACCVTTQATLTPYSQVIFETNRYSVPAEAAQRLMRRTLTVQAFPFTVEIIGDEASPNNASANASNGTGQGGAQVLATHPRSYASGQDVCDPQHYLSLLQQRPGAFDHAKPIRQWRQSETWPTVYDELLRQLREAQPDGAGVREFVRILKLHADHSARHMEQAVKEALAHRRPSYDSVRLCLHRLAQPPHTVPPLDLSQQPQFAHLAQNATTSTWAGLQAADLHRYDDLLTLTHAMSSEAETKIEVAP